MQIPTNFSAAQAVSIASVVSSRDKNSVLTAPSADVVALQTQLEKSESASPDRDAQGQGDGLGRHARKPQDGNAITSVQDSSTVPSTSTRPSDEPPSLLDVVC